MISDINLPETGEEFKVYVSLTDLGMSSGMEEDMWRNHVTTFKGKMVLEALKVEMAVRKKLSLPHLSGSLAAKIESIGDLRVAQPPLFLRKRLLIPDEFLQGHPQKLSNQNIAPQLFNQQTINPYRIKYLNKQRLQREIQQYEGTASV